jgi:ribose-phosphate pyrophosphokinase
MSIYILSGFDRFDVDFIKFSDGAEICELKIFPNNKANIVLDVDNCNVDLVRLMLVKDALDNLGVEHITLTMSYIPNARADRRFSKNQSQSLKVFCNVINSLNFKEVHVSDPHSDVSTALLNNVKVNDQVNCFMQKKPQIDKISNDYVFCSPDLGATKKTFDLSMKTGIDLIQAVKIRDIKTGNIIKCDAQCENLKGKDVVIVDDIADGGASFIYLAEKLKAKGAGKIILFVTHGIFSKGLAPLVGKVDYIFTYNLMEKFINNRDIELFNNKQGE